MGATNTTANYSLSQFISTDKPAWLQDYNGDMLKIDTGINAAKLAADTAQSIATNAQTDATSAVNSVSALASTVSSLSTAIGSITGTLNTITSLIGNGTPTTTDQTIIGAINELNAGKAADSKVGDLSDLDTTDKSSIVAAINEVAQGGGGGGGATGYHVFTKDVTGVNDTAWGSLYAISDYIDISSLGLQTPPTKVSVAFMPANNKTGMAFIGGSVSATSIEVGLASPASQTGINGTFTLVIYD